MRSFLNPSCAIEGIWKTSSKQGQAAPISHDSHRPPENACAKLADCVKSASVAAQGNGLQQTSNPQKVGRHKFIRGGVGVRTRPSIDMYGENESLFMDCRDSPVGRIRKWPRVKRSETLGLMGPSR